MAMVSLESCYERARQSMSQGEYDRAEGICQHVLQYYPQDLGAFQLLGQINLERKQGRAARGFFRRVLEIDPENISAHWGMGIAYQDEQKTEQTIAEFEQALEIKPDLSDLRAQLLRLYGEQYGAAQAQLRLSRAGLGRLYVKGGMLDKAIAEFQEVLKLDPQRADVQVSLIEALWQSGDMEKAARVCEDVLQRLPDALKANLVLGYVHLAAGRREAAEELWRKAAACDPNNTMARVLFETVPDRIPAGMISYGAATLPDFDEDVWKAALAAAAARPEPTPPPAPEPPAVVSKPAAPAAEAAGISWLDSLATGEGAITEEEGELVAGIAPFDLEGIDFGGEAAGPSFALPALEAEPAPFALEEEPAAVTPEEEPASLELEELAPLAVEEESLALFADEAPAPAGDQEMKPFSLADLGLSADEIASLEEAIASTKSGEAAPPPAGLAEEEAFAGLAPFSLEEGGTAGAEAELPGLAPFSLEEVGAAGAEVELPGLAPFSLEEVGAAGAEVELPGLAPFSLEEVGAAGADEVDLPGLAPFSLEEDLTGPAGPTAPGPAPFALEEAAAPGGMAPFSLDELVPGGPADEAELPGLAPFSLEGAVPGGEELPEIPGLEPFSVESFGLEQMPGAVGATAGMGGELRPFSLEDLGLDEPLGELEPTAGLDRFSDSLDDVEAGLPTYSWQEASSAKAPAFRGQLESPTESPAGGPSLFEKMKASRQESEGPEEEGAEAAPGAELVAPTEEEMAPFALEELGLEGAPEPIAAAEVPGEAELVGLRPFAVESFGLEPTEEAAAPQPFSLAELGLEGPPAALLGEEAAVQPFLEEVLGEMPPVEAPVAAPAEDVLRPFSLEELGLTPDEIADLGLEPEAAPAAAAAPAPVEELGLPAFEELFPPAVEEVLPAVEEVLPAVEEVLPAVEEVLPAVEEVLPVVEEVLPAGLSLEELRAQVAAHPQDETMLLALARGGVAQGAPDEAFDLYKRLIKGGRAGLEDALVGDIQSWIEREEDRKRLYRLHRLLGDAYMKKGWYQQAINEYAWVLSKQ